MDCQIFFLKNRIIQATFCLESIRNFFTQGLSEITSLMDGIPTPPLFWFFHSRQINTEFASQSKVADTLVDQMPRLWAESAIEPDMVFFSGNVAQSALCYK